MVKTKKNDSLIIKHTKFYSKIMEKCEKMSVTKMQSVSEKPQLIFMQFMQK